MTVDPFTSAGPKAEDTRERNAKRDTKGRYLIPKLPEGYAGKLMREGAIRGAGDTPWTRATTFAKSISDTYTLSAWSQRMAVKGLASRADLVLAAAACPVSDKGTLDSIVDQAKDAAAARASANLGTAMHNLTQDVDQGRLTDLSALPSDAQRDLRAYAALLAEHGIEMIPGMTEKTVVNDTFGIAGTFDRIVMFRGRPTVLDLKTGRDLQYGWNEIGIQLALYAYSDAIYDWDQEVFLPLPENLDRTHGLVIHLPVGRGVAELYEVDLEPGWAACQLCHDVRRWRANRKLSRLVTVAAPNTPGAVVQGALGAAVEASVAKAADQAGVAYAGGQTAPELAPLADPAKGEKGCSICHRKGHRKGSPKCLGLNDPQFDDPNALLKRSEANVARVAAEAAPLLAEEDEAEPFCPRTGPCSGAGWTAPAQDGDPWVCGNCGQPSRTGQIKGDGVPVTGTIGMPAAAPALGTEPVTAEEVADPFAEPTPEPVAARPPSWAEQINAASSKGEIRAIRDEATKAGAWTPELQAVGIARLGVISEPAG